ncbi:Ubiquitin-conjugating enzyme [Orobanche gracilis]
MTTANNTHRQDRNPNTPSVVVAPAKQSFPAAKTVDTQSVLKR